MADASSPAATQTLDILIIGAGVSGIGMACHLRKECPGKNLLILERRAAIGGTWDLFRYPGIRSDSDMMTFGYRFAPWIKPQILADGGSIKGYVTKTAEANGITERIRFGRKALSASWSSQTALWTVEVSIEGSEKKEVYTARFLLGCTGYYNYDEGFKPHFEGEKSFKGQIIHPQQWPANLDYSGKRVIVIGSGATAVTLVPAMVDKAAHVTMVQRSPSYFLPIPSMDRVSQLMQKVMPDKWVYRITRARNVAFQQFVYQAAKRRPKAMKRFLLSAAKKQLQGKVDMRHFTPNYEPWDQRLCVIPDGDLFRVLREGKASVATDHIERFTPKGLKLASGEEIEADIIITATGLDLQMFGGMALDVDGAAVKPGEGMMYKAVMLQGLPNTAMVFGYINASWTLKADLSAEFVCRLINHMDAENYQQVTPVAGADEITEHTMMGSLASGYVKRAAHLLPRQGKTGHWQVAHNYKTDTALLRDAPIADEGLEFRRVVHAASTGKARK